MVPMSCRPSVADSVKADPPWQAPQLADRKTDWPAAAAVLSSPLAGRQGLGSKLAREAT